MDTKTLHDWAADAGLVFDKTTPYRDATAEWTDRLMESPDDLTEVWLGFLSTYQPAMAEGRDTLLLNVGKASEDLTKMLAYGDVSRMLTLAYSGSVQMRLANIGMEVLRMMRVGAENFFEKDGERLWADVVNYHNDMEEGQ